MSGLMTTATACVLQGLVKRGGLDIHMRRALLTVLRMRDNVRCGDSSAEALEKGIDAMAKAVEGLGDEADIQVPFDCTVADLDRSVDDFVAQYGRELGLKTASEAESEGEREPHATVALGARVKIKGLQSRPDLNGREGTVSLHPGQRCVWGGVGRAPTDPP